MYSIVRTYREVREHVKFLIQLYFFRNFFFIYLLKNDTKIIQYFLTLIKLFSIPLKCQV